MVVEILVEDAGSISLGISKWFIFSRILLVVIWYRDVVVEIFGLSYISIVHLPGLLILVLLWGSDRYDSDILFWFLSILTLIGLLGDDSESSNSVPR